MSDFAAKNTSPANASIVSDFLRTEIVKLGKVTVVEKSSMDKILAKGRVPANRMHGIKLRRKTWENT